MLVVLILCGNSLLANPLFDTHFTGNTLRFDYYHTGTATEEHFAFDQIVKDSPWAGSKTKLVDDLRLGKYLFEVRDLTSKTLLYSREFCSIYGEWETTAETKGLYRSAPGCIMHIRTDYFCPACQRAINLVIDQYTH